MANKCAHYKTVGVMQERKNCNASNAPFFEDGKWYCGMHAPSKVAARNKAKDAESALKAQQTLAVRGTYERRALELQRRLNLTQKDIQVNYVLGTPVGLNLTIAALDALSLAKHTEEQIRNIAVEIGDFIDTPDFQLDPSRNADTIDGVQAILTRTLM